MISICTIYRDEDLHFLEDYLNSVPSNCEVILMRTVQDDIKFVGSKLVEIKEFNGIKIKHCEWTYRTFSFADARNECHKYIDEKSKWIIALDIDERAHLQGSELEQLQNDLIPKDIGILRVGIVTPSLINGEWVAWTGHLYRIYRSHKGFFWIGSVHEQIIDVVILKGYKLLTTSIIFKHLGYADSLNNLKHKYLRNIQLLAKDIYNNTVYKLLPKKNADEFYENQLERIKNTITEFFKNEDDFKRKD